jgi:diketogulonate reductase-like aldo/keto reductase
MQKLQQEGKIKQIGVSNFTPSLLKEAFQYAEIFCNQIEYHPYLSQRSLLDMSLEHDFLLTAYAPIAHGKVNKDEKLLEIASKYSKTPVQVTLRWLIQQPKVSAIPKASSTNHRKSNFEIFDFELTENEMQVIFNLAQENRLVNPHWAPQWDH